MVSSNTYAVPCSRAGRVTPLLLDPLAHATCSSSTGSEDGQGSMLCRWMWKATSRFGEAFFHMGRDGRSNRCCHEYSAHVLEVHVHTSVALMLLPVATYCLPETVMHTPSFHDPLHVLSHVIPLSLAINLRRSADKFAPPVPRRWTFAAGRTSGLILKFRCLLVRDTASSDTSLM